ncbi:MAG TPA: HAD-IA family hydrolase [Tepidisphaeraceae bacterium]|jgi:putative hydrolase of the HAD superfamily|nr:HAD-IA family hydrolase [Tepidisphaeraceae bacterium]
MRTLVLDAMGVIYQSGDDVAELLCPFVHENGGSADDRQIESLYRDASLGRISANQFWHDVGLSPDLEDAYLLRHRLTPGLHQFLKDVRPYISSIWCLSNDVSRWSRKLRRQFALEQDINGFVISGDVGTRKPDEAIYLQLLLQTGAKPEDIILVDDRPANLNAAERLGLQAILFGAVQADHICKNRAVADFGKLLRYFTQTEDRESQ